MKAKPAAYVRICDLYGVGYYYIPGTDTCLKVGGFINADWYWRANNAPGGGFTIANGVEGTRTRWANDLASRARAVVTLDARTQTAYGTLRSYILGGWQATSPISTNLGPSAVTPYLIRAFIQFAGFTFGRTASFYDIFHFAPSMTNTAPWIGGPSGAAGLAVLAYTAQFGQGFSATISLEDRDFRKAGVLFVAAPPAATLAAGTSQTASRVPEVVLNLRVDQAWGTLGVSGALHDTAAFRCGPGPVFPACGVRGKWGWAVGIGGVLNIPGMPGSQVGAQFDYANGASAYILSTLRAVALYNGASQTSVAVGTLYDGVIGPTGGVRATRGWSINAGWQHRWSPQLASSIYGGYVRVNNPNSLLAPAGFGSPDWGVWQIGTRPIQWTPVPNLNIGVDVMYSRYLTAYGPAIAAPGPSAVAAPTRNQSVISGVFRVQRLFWP
jgi:hypothetical protein